MTATRRALPLFILAIAAWPQAAPQSGQPDVVSHEAPATFSSRVNLVSVPVVIRDRDGKAVGGLRQEDFQLADKGKSQLITKFSIETSATAARVTEPPPVSSNETTEPAVAPKPVLPGRFVAYFFDDIHLTTGDLLQARQAANRHLDQALDPNTRAGIFTTSGQVTQDFTSDLAKLHAAVNKIKPWEQGLSKNEDCPYISYYVADVLVNQSHVVSPIKTGSEILAAAPMDPLLGAVVEETAACLCNPMEPGCPERIGAAVKTAASLALSFGMTETKTALFTLRDLIRSVSVLPGSRTIVMVSPGFIMSAEHRLDENDIFDKAIHANVTINTLDIRGLYTPPGLEASDRGHTGAGSAALLQADSAAASAGGDLLAEMAAGTGGTFFHNSNALEEGLNQVAARPEYIYVLGFSPDNLKFDGSYHRLKVALKNGNSMTVEARRGYWAPNHAINPSEQAKEDIEDAVFSREEMLDIPVKLHTEFFKQNDVKAELTAETRIDLKTLKFKRTDDRNRDTLVVVTGLFDQNGRYVKGTERTLDMQLRDQTLESARNSGMIVKESFDVTPGRYVVRVVVRDSEGRSMAAQNEGVEIP